MTVPPVAPGAPEPSSGRVPKPITDEDLAQIAELLTERRKQVAGGAATAGPAEPNMRESLLDDAKTLFGGVAGLALFYGVAIYLAVHGSLFCVFFFAMAFTYTALFAGMLANSFRLSYGAFVAVGVLMAGWALVAVSFGSYHYALAVGAYGVWALVTAAAFWYGEDRLRTRVLAVVAHSLALTGFGLVDAGWRVDSSVAGLSLAVSLALGYLALRHHVSGTRNRTGAGTWTSPG